MLTSDVISVVSNEGVFWIVTPFSLVYTSRRIRSACCHLGGRDSSVGIAIRYGLDGLGIESRRGGGAKFSAPVQTSPEAHPASCTMGTGSFPGVKRPGRGADHLPPSSVPRS